MQNVIDPSTLYVMLVLPILASLTAMLKYIYEKLLVNQCYRMVLNVLILVMQILKIWKLVKEIYIMKQSLGMSKY